MNEIAGNIVKRSDKVAYIGVEVSGAETFMRMQGFTALTPTKNPAEYTRQYVDEEFERSEVVRYKPEIAYGFDLFTPNSAQQPIVDVHDGEKLGSDTYVYIVVVDYSKEPQGGAYPATKRQWAIVPSGEADGTDAYTYSGKFAAQGALISGTAEVDANQMTATFAEA